MEELLLLASNERKAARGEEQTGGGGEIIRGEVRREGVENIREGRIQEGSG